jgi:ABC-2 type transport system permease protein
MNRYLTLVKREYWENRGGFLWAPLVTGGVFVLLMVMGILITEAAAGRARIQIGMLKLGDALQAMDTKARLLFGLGVDSAIVQIAVLIGFVVGIVVFFYCLGALYDERRDRSILFWKSLPVSDGETVLSKVVSAGLLAPLIGFVAVIATSFLALLALTAWLALRGTGLAGMVWTESHLFRVLLTLMATVPVGLVFALPTIGWLLLCSAWARTKPFLWAVLLPLGAGILVAWFGLMQSLSLPSAWFWKNVVARALLGTFPGNWMSWENLTRFERSSGPEEALQLISPGMPLSALADPAPWIAAAVGVGMIVIAIRLRRRRELAD